MLTDPLRRLLQGSLDAIAKFFHRLGISANALTLGGAALHLVVLYFLAQGAFVAGALVLLIASGLDGIDGTLARITGQASPIGAFLDSTLDRVSEIIVYLGLLLFAERALAAGQTPLFQPWLAYLAITGSVMVSYSRARSEGIGLPTRSGIFTRFERMAALWLGLMSGQLVLALWVVTIGAWLTTLQRVTEVWRSASLAEAATLPQDALDTARPIESDPNPAMRNPEGIERGSKA
jgi:CDP-diacylglycerol--glycerol-3-phosphate 3-phosphatidyltransferase